MPSIETCVLQVNWAGYQYLDHYRILFTPELNYTKYFASSVRYGQKGSHDFRLKSAWKGHFLNYQDKIDTIQKNQDMTKKSGQIKKSGKSGQVRPLNCIF